MIQLVWDAERLGTATASSGASASVGELAHFTPDDLLAMAIATCVMRTFLRLAADAKAAILGYAATASADASCEPDGEPHVIVHSYVVAPSSSDARALAELAAQSARTSPIARVMGKRVTVTAEVRLLTGAEAAVR